MSADILKLLRNGTPETLCANLAEKADDIEFMLVVRVMKDGKVEHDWTSISNSLTALGAAETLKEAMLRACDSWD